LFHVNSDPSHKTALDTFTDDGQSTVLGVTWPASRRLHPTGSVVGEGGLGAIGEQSVVSVVSVVM
jgi:hypothetical protein